MTTLITVGLLALPVFALVYFCWITENWGFLGACGVTACAIALIAIV
tara:strand:+ start:162 stop:302 length:141 start_codon:yes stop_codon:yes gene_type:complete